MCLNFRGRSSESWKPFFFFFFFLHFDYYCNTTWIHSYVNFTLTQVTFSPFCALPPRSVSQMFTSSSATLLLTSCPASQWSASLASWDFIWPKVTFEHKHGHLNSLTETGRVRGCRRADNYRIAVVEVELFSKTIEGWFGLRTCFVYLIIKHLYARLPLLSSFSQSAAKCNILQLPECLSSPENKDMET